MAIDREQIIELWNLGWSVEEICAQTQDEPIEVRRVVRELSGHEE